VTFRRGRADIYDAALLDVAEDLLPWLLAELGHFDDGSLVFRPRPMPRPFVDSATADPFPDDRVSGCCIVRIEETRP